jgi:hypothetical protein
LRELTGDSYDVFFKGNLWNLWNRIPFLDLPEYIAVIKEHGIPIIQDQSSIVPLGDGPQSCYHLRSLKSPHGDGWLSGFAGAAVLFENLLNSLGISATVLGLSEESAVETAIRLSEMANRANKVAKSW